MNKMSHTNWRSPLLKLNLILELMTEKMEIPEKFENCRKKRLGSGV